MIETITPAVCGSRRRARAALAVFAVCAVVAAAMLGALLGLVGEAVGARGAVAVLALVATLAALRELGLVRVPIPQARAQVPERWRAELPLPLWAAGYGAGLGVGLFTFQPVATFWVACAGALVLANPVAGAACLALFGLGRALMVVLPARGRRDPAAAAERLAARGPAVRRANGVTLAVVALVLALAPVSGAAGPKTLPLGDGSQLDPSVSAGVLAFGRRSLEDTVVVGEAPQAVFRGRSPSLDESLLAYEDDAGVAVLNWHDRAELVRVPGATRPALDWPWLAYRSDAFDGTRELWLRNLSTGDERLVASVQPRVEIGRPSVRAGRLAFHVAGPGGSRIELLTIATDERCVVARSRVALLAHPSLGSSRIAWVDSSRGVSRLRVRRLDPANAPVLTLARTWGRHDVFWTTALGGRTVYVTRWNTAEGYTTIERVRF